MRAIELSGQRFGRLTVVSREPNVGTQAMWLARCDCGNETTVRGAHLRGGHIVSCGCRRAEDNAARALAGDIKRTRSFHDLTGRRFGRLLVECRAPSRLGITRWNCTCDCGERSVVRADYLNSGMTTSCGCNARRALGHAGAKSQPEYGIWVGMVRRCHDESDPAYYRYGGRGIRVCNEWRSSYAVFFQDMGPRPSPTHTLDRVDNGRGYEQANCRWATKTEQARNRRSNTVFTYAGKTMCVADWADELGLKRQTIYDRLALGWTFERAVTQPVRRTRAA